MTRDVDGTATFAVYGPNRELVWLSVHALTPTVVRLWPLVVRFLRDTLDDLADPSNTTLLWRLPQANIHPEYVVIRVPAGDPWLYLFAASPNAICLTEDRQAFLREALAELPTMAADRVARRQATMTDVAAAGN
jgi:hypothetical protein